MLGRGSSLRDDTRDGHKGQVRRRLGIREWLWTALDKPRSERELWHLRNWEMPPGDHLRRKLREELYLLYVAGRVEYREEKWRRVT